MQRFEHISAMTLLQAHVTGCIPLLAMADSSSKKWNPSLVGKLAWNATVPEQVVNYVSFVDNVTAVRIPAKPIYQSQSICHLHNSSGTPPSCMFRFLWSR